MAGASDHVILAGATGHIGQAVAAELDARQYPHIVLTRHRSETHEDEPAAAHRHVRVADVTNPVNLAAALDGVRADVVISCLASRTGVRDDAWKIDYDANRHLLDAARRAGARHFILLSALCVQRPKLEFQRAKLAFESELMASGMTYSVVRPTAFFKSLSGQIPRVLAGKPFLVFGDGRATACKPIGEADLARFIVDCIDDASRHDRTLPIGGPGDAVTPRDQGELLFRLLGRPAEFRSVPVAIFKVAAALLTPIGALIPAAAAKAELARIGRYYATESMLVWDAEAERYDAEATPGFGTTTLEDHYRRLLRDGLAGYEAGEQRLF